MLSLTLANSLTSMSLGDKSFAGISPNLAKGFANHTLEKIILRNLHSHVRKSKLIGLSRSARRKIINRRKRWFVDNIVMHHKRIHDKNRQTTVDDMRKKALEKREALKKRQPTLQEALSINKDGPIKWSEKVDLRKRSLDARDRINSRRARAKS
ncbi:MAG: hypothetical protein KGQ36_02315, partial [Rickettsiales bacterium]|nr:hypothetical protein [Rickettsiales bacterium]